MYSVYIYEGEPPSLTTDSKEKALEYWYQNHRKVTGNVGVLDRSADGYCWIA